MKWLTQKKGVDKAEIWCRFIKGKADCCKMADRPCKLGADIMKQCYYQISLCFFSSPSWSQPWEGWQRKDTIVWRSQTLFFEQILQIIPEALMLPLPRRCICFQFIHLIVTFQTISLLRLKALQAKWQTWVNRKWEVGSLDKRIQCLFKLSLRLLLAKKCLLFSGEAWSLS